ncbi:MAG: arsenosugar biosynthesis radical SAM (seleno)protein ArsS [Planctomycetota bacterium]
MELARNAQVAPPSLPPLPVLPDDAFCSRFDNQGLIAADRITTLQINIGLVCNLACKHCHVESSPKRTGADENMSRDTADRVLDWLATNPGLETLDLTGGSPEMNPHFRRLVEGARALGLRVMDRCNPTIIPHKDASSETSFEWVPDFLAQHEVEVVASLPCYLEDNVRKQRGLHAYDASIDGLQRLNAVGYGSDSALRLNLVYNPVGPSLPPPQSGLAEDYRRELDDRFGIVFNELWTITNMPIKRWRDDLERAGKLESYMRLLVDAYNPATIDGLMCRHQIHIDSQGRLHDCDFNHALALRTPGCERRRLWDVSLQELAVRRIATGDHCYGCTAGAGSSCGGSIA